MGQKFYHASGVVLTPMIRRAWKIHAEGVDNVPKEGAAILASNHLSYLDHYTMPAMIPGLRMVYFISKAQHFDVPIQRWLFEQWGVIPLRRGQGDDEALARAREVLRAGNLLCIYPEGTRSTDGKLHRGRTGVARLALEIGVPVIPVGMIGSDIALPKGKNWPKFSPIEVRFGAPMKFTEFAGMQDDRKVTREVTDRIMRAIGALTGQSYVDTYAFSPDYAKGERAATASAAPSAPGPSEGSPVPATGSEPHPVLGGEWPGDTPDRTEEHGAASKGHATRHDERPPGGA
ncbi:MAG: lysophospholipid acyltransferase family protein [Thermoplasmatota archaeon]